jgi:hypothetical protein
MRLVLKLTYKLKNTVYWNVTPCGSYKNRRLGGTYHLHHRGEKNQRARKNMDSFHPDDGGNTFLRDFGSYKSHAATHPRRRYTS